MVENENGDLYDELERRALDALPEDADDESVDLVGSLRPGGGNGESASTEPGMDLTLGGYIELHDRVPAFEGTDNMPYTVDVDVEPRDEASGEYAAFLVFIRWAETGAGIMDHVESGDVARAATEDDARQAALDLSLYEVKAELDAAIERRRRALEEFNPEM